MSRVELEAFYRFRANAKFDSKSTYYLSTNYIDDSNIIETSLKEKERLERERNELANRNMEKAVKLKKQDEILRIIKEKRVVFEFFDKTSTYEEYNKAIRNNWNYKEEDYKKYLLTQEEFDLLKEVLL